MHVYFSVPTNNNDKKSKRSSWRWESISQSNFGSGLGISLCVSVCLSVSLSLSLSLSLISHFKMWNAITHYRSLSLITSPPIFVEHAPPPICLNFLMVCHYSIAFNVPRKFYIHLAFFPPNSLFSVSLSPPSLCLCLCLSLSLSLSLSIFSFFLFLVPSSTLSPCLCFSLICLYARLYVCSSLA
ncbi:unnamed protein product [Acanthosepion pharaonis]|uniref:Uncharacterized protein n=1 Tax=Acanthosepion pharaonis TaxID=158019 RepID=A0A812CIK3_ACAPH|nr:unnamed protein product [Sepia pharaonis]